MVKERAMFKITKGNCSNKKVSTMVVSDEDSSYDEEQMVLLAKKITRFFKNKKSYSCGVRRDNLSKKDSRSVKNDNGYEDELEKKWKEPC